MLHPMLRHGDNIASEIFFVAANGRIGIKTKPMSKGIEIIVRGVLVRNGHILLCHNKRKKNYFLPGGHIEFNEGAKLALQREIREETGLKSEVGRFLGATEHTFRNKGQRLCEINLVFEFEIRGARASRLVPSAEKKIEFVWLPLRKLSQSRIKPPTLIKDLPDWLKNDRSPRWGSSYKTKGCR
jgi:8-oxo-dGTP diphosphatase